jgi:hypothetical protein
MSDNEEQIYYITIFHIIPPFFGAALGGLLGLLLSWCFDLNAFYCLAIGGYSSALILFVILYRLGGDENDTELPRSVRWRALRFWVSLYGIVATVALLLVAMWPVERKLGELKERERQSRPQEPRE